MSFANTVRIANLPGVGRDGVEQSFSLGDLVSYGTDGSVRTDVALWDDEHKGVIAIYDLKTGSAQLSPSRIEQLMAMVRREKGARRPAVFELRLKLRPTGAKSGAR